MLILGLDLLIFQLGPNTYEKYILRKHIEKVMFVCNNYSWENYSGKEGMEFFSKDMQRILYLNDIKYNIQYIKENKVISKGYIDRINDIKTDGKKAQISLVSRRIITDIKSTADFKTLMVISLYKENNKWIIDNIIFSKKEVL
ncbi:hypothetical protein SAMN02745123_02042 [Desulforamulus aeronauticus DSM 10349]|uniref:Lumazine-binding n=1 Tax=Desulforamulus aeronauticus DSM 10349 TaxID=1121421 RepID=A0A1M6SVE3_9FIRM|nr:hypothetical protein SAMN02745123_02042 [Desulforamulus aeronauticus DSM 10349]